VIVLFHNIKNIFLVEELRRKILFTLGVFAVFRFGVQIPIPGVDIIALKAYLDFAGTGLLSYLDLFSGGALQRASIFLLGISPYISASIMMQLLTVMIPTLEQLSKEGEYGRRIINQYTRYLTLLLSVVQGFGAAALLENAPRQLVLNPGWGFKLFAVLMLSVGSLFVMWLGEQINAHGLGNGSSMVIFAGIITRFPGAVIKIVENFRMGQASLHIIALLFIITIAIIGCIIFLERGERRVPVQYARRIVGNKMYGGQSSYIPFKLNSAGVIPVIFATMMINMPMMIASFLAAKWPEINTFFMNWFTPDKILYSILNAGLIIFFSFFYTAIIFNPIELADNIRKSGGFIPGIRPGKRTAEFFDYLLTRIGFPGALYLALLAIIPGFLRRGIGFPVMFDGVSLLIVIGVALDASAQIESHLIERKYEGFLSTGRLKTRFGR
jgi:preprotein translocase subunit SecY